MLESLSVFALIGLFTGGTARLFYPGRQPLRILATMAIGMGGSLLGGLLSWALWPVVEGQYSSGALLTSILGAVLALVLWAAVAYARSIGVFSRVRGSVFLSGPATPVHPATPSSELPGGPNRAANP